MYFIFNAEKKRYSAIRGEPLRIAACLFFSAVKFEQIIIKTKMQNKNYSAF